MREATEKNQRFVYYTRAETAFKIISNGELWLRSAALMNDASEIWYGLHCLKTALRTGGETKLRAVLDGVHPGVVDAVLRRLLQSEAALLSTTYIACLSEHLGGREDRFGRLSMWRAYGDATGTALVFNGRAMLSDSDALHAYSSPVIYPEQHEYDKLFGQLCSDLAVNAALLATQAKRDVETDLWDALRFAVMSTKHPAFAEELEWRIIYSPTERRSSRVPYEIKILNTIPQIVYTLKLQNVPQDGLTGMEIGEGLDRVIIGPCQHPIEMHHAFVEALAAKGISDPQARVHISWVPLRVRG